MDKMKVMSSKFMKGALLAVGIPYGIVIITNMVSGWPCSKEGEDKYKTALQPSRVLKVSYAVAEQFNLLRFLPVYVKWCSLYRDGSKVIKDLKYGVNGNTLDLWTPYDDSRPKEPNSRPVVVFIYGGAWGSGDKNMYGLLAQELMNRIGAVVVIPNYSIYPKGEVTEMVRDVHDTLSFIKSADFLHRAPDADQNRIVLFGHSAGAHLCALSAIQLAEEIPSKGSVDQTQDGDNATGRTDSDVMPSDLLSSVRGVVGLGGVYHIMDHYHHETWRGVEDLSPMWRAMKGLENFDLYSPTDRVSKMTSEQIQRLPPMYLIHGTDDKVVPQSSTEKFSSVLMEREADVTVRLLAEGGHAELVVDMMDRGRKFYDAMMNLTLEFSEKML